jgi:hypothetical protein
VEIKKPFGVFVKNEMISIDFRIEQLETMYIAIYLVVDNINLGEKFKVWGKWIVDKETL